MAGLILGDSWTGTSGNDYYDFSQNGFPFSAESHNSGYGDAGDDTILGGDGKDSLFGGSGDDYLSGGFNDDYLVGGPGVDQLYGGSNFPAEGYIASDQPPSVDTFVFDVWSYSGSSQPDTGDIFFNQADTIHDFGSEDSIVLLGDLSYAGNTLSPGEDQYSIWQKGPDWVVTYNSSSDSGFHDIVVQGADPHGHVELSFLT